MLLRVKLFVLMVLCVPLLASAADADISAVETKEQSSAGPFKSFTQTFKSNGGYLDLGMRFGYIYGQNSYDMNHHVSELEFPFRTYMGGGKINIGYKDLSINAEAWSSLFDDPSAGWHTKDKDWDSAGNLESDTKSYSDMNAIIWDLSMRYNLLKFSFGKKSSAEECKRSENIKLGFLMGYRFERFGYKDYGLYQTNGSDSSYGDGELVSEYKVKYNLPYFGLAMDVGNEKMGVQMNAKYGFKPHAKDYDNHYLRKLNFYADYKKKPNVFMANFVLFYKFLKNWEANLGADAALIRMDGRTWENSSSNWDLDQSIDTKQFIYWMGVGYKF
ncbi:MAG: omptin family outer membrane protease [Candidatus Omnitrophica bacterium]|nr:omptin family outer membrane protease [Candidatus Omnitrophota bacterium]